MSEMKKQKTKQASGSGQKREAEEALPVPTLGQVAEEERFAPLRGLILPVTGTPVNELGEDLRRDLREAIQESPRFLLSAFFGACDARAGEIERKRAHVASGEESPGKQQRERLLSNTSWALLCCNTLPMTCSNLQCAVPLQPLYLGQLAKPSSFAYFSSRPPLL